MPYAFWFTLGHLFASTLVLVIVMLRVNPHCPHGAATHAATIAAKLFADALVLMAYLRQRVTVRGDGRIDPEGTRPDEPEWPYGEPPF